MRLLFGASPPPFPLHSSLDSFLMRCEPTRSAVTTTNPRGIPAAPFVDKVEDYVSSRAEVEQTLRSFQEMIAYVSSPRLPVLPVSLLLLLPSAIFEAAAICFDRCRSQHKRRDQAYAPEDGNLSSSADFVPWQEIPVHGAEPPTTSSWSERQAPRHPEDSRHGPVSQIQTGMKPEYGDV